MAKHNAPFDKSARQPATDPVKEAHAAALSEQAAATEQKKDPIPVDLMQEVKVTAAEEPVKGTEQAAPKETVHVQDTTQASSGELTESFILKSQRQEKARGNVVHRPSGASTREASPSNQSNKADHVTSNDFSALMASERTSGTTNAVSIISFLDTYVKAMAPRKITSATEVVRMQEGLLDQLLYIIRQAPAKEFNRLWNIVIKYVGEYKDGAFNPKYYHRGARDWKRDPSQFNTLTSLINLLQASATDMATVNDVVNINAVVGAGFSEDARGRMINFYMK